MTDEYIWPYWSVDFPGLTERSARRLVAWAAREHLTDPEGSLVDPAWWFSNHMDESTASALAAAIDCALRTGTLSSEQSIIVRGFSEQLAEWLADRRPTE